MRIAVLSDTHIPSSTSRLPDLLLEQLKGIDMIIHAGDLTEIYVLDELNKICRTEAVAGNMDSYKVRKSLTEKIILELSGFRIGIIHGWGPPDNLIEYVQEKFKLDKVDCIIYGHSHNPKIDTIDNTIYFNPGSPTDRVFAPYRSFGILDIDKTINPAIIKL